MEELQKQTQQLERQADALEKLIDEIINSDAANQGSYPNNNVEIP